MNKFLDMKARGNSILFSEILAEIPSDDVLLELFPDRITPGNQTVTQRGLEILKLRLEGFNQSEIAEKLHITQGQVAYSSGMITNGLRGNIPPYVNIDVPALGKVLRMDFTKTAKYGLLSELLRDMPSDEEILQLFEERGNIIRKGAEPPVTNQDLQLLQMREQKHSFAEISETKELDEKEVRHRISLTLRRLQHDLKIELDVPAVYKPRHRAALPLRSPAQPHPTTERDDLDIISGFVGAYTQQAERLFHEYKQYCSAAAKGQELIFLPLTHSEIEIIIEALEVYGADLKSQGALRMDSDSEKLPYDAQTVSDLYKKAQNALSREGVQQIPLIC